MGTGIAQAAALGGYQITLIDTEDRPLRLALSRISRDMDKGVQRGKLDPCEVRKAKRAFMISTNLKEAAKADLVIEAIQDDFDQKVELLKILDGFIKPDTILATTSDTLSLTLLAAETGLPERVVGMHFFNPAHIMRLVEVIQGERTAQSVLDRAQDFVRKINKTPLLVQDGPGLIVNRVAQAYYGEALFLLDDASLDAETIDRLLEAAGFPMGPFKLIDYLGVDVAFEVTRSIYEATFHAAPYRPHPRYHRMIQSGRLGRKTGRGFYSQ
jgi:3-hydroxybutyryl-CoA dehydrogenase